MASSNRALWLSRIFFFLASTVLLIASSNCHAQESSQAPKNATGTDDIRETIVRFQTNSFAGGDDIFCIKVEDKDPSSQLLLRFQEAESAPQKESECGKGVEASRLRMHLWQGNIQLTSRNSVKVEGGYFCGLLCAAKGTFVLKRRNGEWKVSKFVASWYS